MGTWTTTPRTWVAGEVPTAAYFNSNLRDFGRAFADAWTSYTPTLTCSTTNPTASWTQTGYYLQAGKLVHVKGVITAPASSGATPYGAGNYRIALPVNAATTITDAVCAGAIYLFDNSATVGRSDAVAYVANTAYVQLRYAAGSTPVIVAATTPWTWAQNDYIQFAFTYEAA